MVLLMYQYLSANTEAAKAARLVPISLPTRRILVRAAQATVAPTQAIADIAGTVLLTSVSLRVITEAGKTARHVPMLLQILTIQVRAAQATAVLIQAQAVIAITVLLT